MLTSSDLIRGLESSRAYCDEQLRHLRRAEVPPPAATTERRGGRRPMSAEGRKRISEAVRQRWAQYRFAKKGREVASALRAEAGRAGARKRWDATRARAARSTR